MTTTRRPTATLAWVSVITAAALCLSCSSAAQNSAADPSCVLASATTPGPGDSGRHFPIAAGNRWFYEVHETQQSFMGASSWVFPVRKDASSTPGSGEETVLSTTLLARVEIPPWSGELRVRPGSSGLAVVAQVPSDGWNEIALELPQLRPFVRLPFPLEAGMQYAPVTCAGVPVGNLHGNGVDTLDVESRVSVAGPEPVVVPAGSFTAMRVDTELSRTVHDPAGDLSLTWAQSEWFAPGVGCVRRVLALSDGLFLSTAEERLSGYVVDGQPHALARRATLAGFTNTSGTPDMSLYPDRNTRPALAFHGTGHLLVSGSSPGYGRLPVLAREVSADGVAAPPFFVFERTGDAWAAAVAFNGTSHLVAVAACATEGAPATCDRVLGQRVTPAGGRLDGPGGFEIAIGGGVVHEPAVASDGSGWLVAFSDDSAGLRAALVSPAGQVLTTATLRSVGALGTTAVPVAVAHGGDSYLVVWLERGQDLLATRVRSDGVVLDASPIVVSSAPREKELGGVASDGSGFLVVWGDARLNPTTIGTPPYDVFAARVSGDGILLDGPPDTGGIVVNAFAGIAKREPSVAFDGTQFAVSWLIPSRGVYGSAVATDGALLSGPDGEGIVLADPVSASPEFLHATVAPAADGQVVFAWIGWGQGLNGIAQGLSAIEGAWYRW